ncbi:hypothetical protein QJS66_00305 [Kocuria rhizophila]|nr:hypothetical protein QJS66_00305 [Kocuria rhizophila]
MLERRNCGAAALAGQGDPHLPGGREAKAYFDFQHRGCDDFWTGDTDSASTERAGLHRRLMRHQCRPTRRTAWGGVLLVYTQFNSMVSQEPRVLGCCPWRSWTPNDLGTT